VEDGKDGGATEGEGRICLKGGCGQWRRSGDEDQVRDIQGANLRGWHKVGKIKSKKSSTRELSSGSALMGPARTELRPVAVPTAATRKATLRELVWRGGRRRS
jgi:hypothetical protein